MADATDIRLEFDDGKTIELRIRSRDLLAVEREFGNVEDLSGLEGLYTVAYAALKRRAARGEDVPVPASLEELYENADLEVVGENGSSGKDSAPAPTTG